MYITIWETTLRRSQGIRVSLGKDARGGLDCPRLHSKVVGAVCEGA